MSERNLHQWMRELKYATIREAINIKTDLLNLEKSGLISIPEKLHIILQKRGIFLADELHMFLATGFPVDRETLYDKYSKGAFEMLHGVWTNLTGHFERFLDAYWVKPPHRVNKKKPRVGIVSYAFIHLKNIKIWDPSIPHNLGETNGVFHRRSLYDDGVVRVDLHSEDDFYSVYWLYWQAIDGSEPKSEYIAIPYRRKEDRYDKRDSEHYYSDLTTNDLTAILHAINHKNSNRTVEV